MSSKPSDSSNFMDQLVNFTLCQEDLRGGRIVWCIFSIFFFVLGFPVYICIFYEWCQKYSTGSLPLTPYNFFMLNLTIMDWGFLFTFPFGLGNHFLLHNWVIESIWNGIYALSICGRPLIMACVCIDCYLAVVYPLLYRNWTTLHPRVVVALVIWLVTVTFGLMAGIVPQLYLTFVAILPFVLALVIIIICDGFILYTLMKASPGGKTVHPQKQRAIETITTSLAASLLSYMPPVLIFIVGKLVITNNGSYYCLVVMPMSSFSSMGSAVMPILFLHNLGGFDRWKAWWRKKTLKPSCVIFTSASYEKTC